MKLLIALLLGVLVGMGVQSAAIHEHERRAAKVLDITSLRDMRIECLSAIFHRIPSDKWNEMAKHMANSPNVCLIAQFLYRNEPLPDPDASKDQVEAATKAVDHAD
jgi:hypothetical protein